MSTDKDNDYIKSYINKYNNVQKGTSLTKYVFFSVFILFGTYFVYALFTLPGFKFKKMFSNNLDNIDIDINLDKQKKVDLKTSIERKEKKDVKLILKLEKNVKNIIKNNFNKLTLPHFNFSQGPVIINHLYNNAKLKQLCEELSYNYDKNTKIKTTLDFPKPIGSRKIEVKLKKVKKKKELSVKFAKNNLGSYIII